MIQLSGSECTQMLKSALADAKGVVNLLFEFAASDWVLHIEVVDLNKDGSPEIVFSTEDGNITVLDNSGGLKWTYSENARILDFFVGDIDLNKKNEIVAGSANKSIIVLNDSGDLITTIQTTAMIRPLEVVNDKLSGSKQIVVGCWDGSVQAYDLSGKLIWRYHIKTGERVNSLSVNDIFSDGSEKIIVGSEDTEITILDAMGNRLGGIETKGDWIRAIRCSCISNKPTQEIVCTTESGKVLVFDSQGTLLCQSIVPDRPRALAIGDLDNDTSVEIAVGAEDGFVYIYKVLPEKNSLKLVWRLNAGSSIRSLAIGDVDQDSLPEIIVGTESSRVQVYKLDLNITLLDQIDGLVQQLKESLELSRVLTGNEQKQVHELLFDKNLRAEPPAIFSGLHSNYIAELINSGKKQDALEKILRVSYYHVMEQWEARVGQQSRVHEVLLSTVFTFDIDNDGQREVLGSLYDATIHVLDEFTGFSKSQIELEQTVLSMFLLHARGGQPKIIVGGKNNIISLVSTAGEREWSFKTGGWIRSVRAADFNNDGEFKIVAASEDCNVYALDMSGNLIWAYRCVEKPLCVYTPHPTLKDEGGVAVVVGSWDRSVYVLNSKGELNWKYAAQSRVFKVYAKDLRKDGSISVIAGADDRWLYVIDETGSLDWQYPVSSWIMALHAADIDADGQDEILVGTESGDLHILSSYGELKWKLPLGDAITAIYVEEYNRECPRILLATGSKKIVALDVVPTLEAAKHHWQCKDIFTDYLQQTHPDQIVATDTDPFIAGWAVSESPKIDADTFMYLFRNGSYVVRSMCSQALHKQMLKFANTKTILVEIAAEQKEAEIRVNAVRQIATHVSIEAQDIKFLNLFIQDVDPLVRRELALQAGFYPKAKWLLNALHDLVNDKDPWVVQEYIRSFAKVFSTDIWSLHSALRYLARNAARSNTAWSLVPYYVHRLMPDLYRTALTFCGLIQTDGNRDALGNFLQAVLNGPDFREKAQVALLWNSFVKGTDISSIEELVEFCNHNDLQIARNETYELIDAELLNNVAEMLLTFSNQISLLDRISDARSKEQILQSVSSRLDDIIKVLEDAPVTPESLAIHGMMLKWKVLIEVRKRQIAGEAKLTVIPISIDIPFADGRTSAIILGVTNQGTQLAYDTVLRMLPSPEVQLMNGFGIERINVLPGNGAREECSFTVLPQKAGSTVCVFELSYRQLGSDTPHIEIIPMVLNFVSQMPFIKIDPIPFVHGPMIKTKEMFFGREKQMQKIRSVISGAYQSQNIILFGQRRIGKSSLLMHIKQELTLPWMPVYLTLQRIMNISTQRFYYYLASEIAREARQAGFPCAEVKKGRFSSPEKAADNFTIFLENVHNSFPQLKLIILLDEFETLLYAIRDHDVSSSIDSVLRGLMQSFSSFLQFIFVGADQLLRLLNEYGSEILRDAQIIKVSRLEREEAELLVNSPFENYQWKVDSIAVERIISLTAGHPFFTQLICWHVVSQLNRERRPFVTKLDVNRAALSVVNDLVGPFSYIPDVLTRHEQAILYHIASATEIDPFVEIREVGELLGKMGYEKKDVVSHINDLIDREYLSRDNNQSSLVRVEVDLIAMWYRLHGIPQQSSIKTS